MFQILSWLCTQSFKLIFFLCVLLFTDDDNIFEKGLATLGLGVVAIIGAAIGLVFLITIILCIVCCCCCGKSNDSNQKQYRAPPTPRPGSYPSHASNYSSYSSSASTTAGRPPYPMHYPPAYPPIQNGGYAVAYNQTNGRMEFPHKVWRKYYSWEDRRLCTLGILNVVIRRCYFVSKEKQKQSQIYPILTMTYV